jgi:RimJ/RimL family protein N-acetyltransferase
MADGGILKRLNQLSLGWRTHLIFPRFDGQVIERADCVVVRTPANPAFWWGNFLLFDEAPRLGDAARWLRRFDEELVQTDPRVQHLAFGVDVSKPFELPADFVAEGLVLNEGTVLQLAPHQLRSASLVDGFIVRPLRLPAEAALAVEAQVASDASTYEPHGYRSHREKMMERYGAMSHAGWGHWFGVFAQSPAGEQLVADCGLFADGPPSQQTLGRFQHVSTHPAWRRRGLCRAMIHAVCRHGFEQMGLQHLVMMADPHDVAIGIYESIGFQRGASTWELERKPLSEWR